MFFLLLKINRESFIFWAVLHIRWNFNALKTLFHSWKCSFNVFESLVVYLVWCGRHWMVCAYWNNVSLGRLTWTIITRAWLSCCIPNFVARFADDFALIYYALVLALPFITWMLEVVHVLYVHFCIFSLLPQHFWSYLFFDTHTLHSEDFIQIWSKR